MPIYLYRCENCGFQFEQRQKYSDDPLRICPECEKEALRKVYFPVGIVFKGSGFYSTDNRSTKGLAQSKSKEESNGKPSVDKPSEEGSKATAKGSTKKKETKGE
jgi:putative FmdB family regulatory protein